MSTRHRETRAWMCIGPAALVALATALPLGGLAAQRVDQEVYLLRSDAPTEVPDLDVRTLRTRGFQLFASGDAAFAGMHTTGGYRSHMTNYGDCSSILRGCQNQRIVRARDGGTNAPFFHLEWVYGTPPGDWLKIRAVAPEAANALGGGYMANAGEQFISRPFSFGPKDGTLGTLFSGATVASDGSCRDHTSAANGNAFGSAEGLQLLPSSDCAETWGSMGWQGSHPIDLEGWKALFDQQGSAFSWDFWRVPEEFQRTDKMFLGTGFHTYGVGSDYGVEQLASYGSAVPGGTGTPARTGYPLGLDISFESFNFAVPTVASAKFVQQLIVNNSAAVYGQGIDYDSIYFGLATGTLFSSQAISSYPLPELGVVLFHENNAKGAGGPCDDAARTAQQGCSGAGGATTGYGNGALAVIVLSSPYGDLRNKLFTRTPSGAPCVVGVDPFCDPTHPNAGDTITFNHIKGGGFGSADAATWGFSARASFGYLSGTEENTLDGRTPADMGSAGFTAFRNEGYPAIQGVHNKFVPGMNGGPGNVWDWNDDGSPDTLFYDICGRLGCPDVSSDTLSMGYVNRGGNIGGVIATGPFPLAAGDTTTWTYVLVGDGDSTRAWSQIEAVLDLYMNFFLAPESPPQAEIVSTQVQPHSDAFGTLSASASFFFSDAPETWVDPFLDKVAQDIAGSAAGTPLNDLLVMNPGLDALVAARARDNLQSIEIYKSCDGGNSFTSDNNCDGEPATDERGNAVGFGWEAYAILDVDDFAGGDIPNSFVDNNVQGGRSYLYVIIGKSRGANFLLNTPTGPDTVVFAPSIRNVLSRSTSDPNVVSIYVPASRQAGAIPADTIFTSRPAGATVPFMLDLSDNVIGGSYRAVFGNEILVDRDSATGAGTPLGSRVTVRRRETVDASGVGVDSVIRTETFAYAVTDVFPVAGSGTAGAPTALGGDTVRTTTTYSGLGYVLVEGSAAHFAGNTLTGANATPIAAFNKPSYPGFAVNVDNSLAGAFNTNGETQLRGPTTIGELGLLDGDTVVQRNIVNGFMVQWLENVAVRSTAGGGIYEVAWSADPFGTARGFDMNRGNPAATEAEIRASLEARPTATTGLTDDSTAALIGVAAADLVDVSIPFTVRNVSSDRPVQLAMVRRVNDRLRLGFGADTISVQLPAGQWVPGDALVFIENIEEEETTGIGLVLGAGGAPQLTTRRAVTFSSAVLGCNTGSTVLTSRCNPLIQGIRGSNGYNPMRDGDRTRFEYYVGIDAASAYAFDAVPPVTGANITLLTDSALSVIQVVPNPYVIFSQYQTSIGQSRLLFTGMPSRGALRIYTVAGQLAQEIKWEPEDLEGDGDLFWNMQTREGIDVASGLYIWVVTAPTNPSDPNSVPIQARGKFVVIRGDSR